MRIALVFLAALAVFLVIDGIWLKLMAKRAYAAEIGGLLRDKPQLGAASLFYLLFAAGLVLFAVMPALAARSPAMAAGLGAALGLVSYGTYNLTNLAVMRGYSGRIAVIDLAWGATASALAAAVVTWGALAVS